MDKVYNAESLVTYLTEQGDYLVRQVTPRGKERAAYEVAKFSWRGKAPTDVYRVSDLGKIWSCDCAGFAKTGDPSHKHIKLVQAWIKAGMPDSLEPKFQDFVQSVIG